jgi:precorrin-6B methylase 2
MDYIKKWLNRMGEIFLIDVGIKQNHSVIYFGCGKGAYVIPAARVVGAGGKVYAADKKTTRIIYIMHIGSTGVYYR